MCRIKDKRRVVLPRICPGRQADQCGLRGRFVDGLVEIKCDGRLVTNHAAQWRVRFYKRRRQGLLKGGGSGDRRCGGTQDWDWQACAGGEDQCNEQKTVESESDAAFRHGSSAENGVQRLPSWLSWQQSLETLDSEEVIFANSLYTCCSYHYGHVIILIVCDCESKKDTMIVSFYSHWLAASTACLISSYVAILPG